jgi:hypothetical protein
MLEPLVTDQAANREDDAIAIPSAERENLLFIRPRESIRRYAEGKHMTPVPVPCEDRGAVDVVRGRADD